MKITKYLKLCFMVLAMMPLAIFAQSNTKLSIESFTINHGETKTMSIDLNNPDMEVTLVQFDLKLPDGLSIASGDDALDIARTTWKKHSLDTNDINGVTRFLLASNSNATLTGTSGAIILVQLKAADTFTGGTIVLQNIEIVAPDATTVHPADAEMVITLQPQQSSVTIQANDLSMVYGDAVPALTYTVIEGQANGTPKLTCEATSKSEVGKYTIHVEKGSLTNETITLIDGTLTISKAPLTITAKSYTIKQGESLPNYEVTYKGFKNGENENVLDKTPTITCEATSNSAPGDYIISVSGAEAKNYNISYAEGRLTIESPANIITDYDGSQYEIGNDYTVTFIGNPNATGIFEIPAYIYYKGDYYYVTAIAEGAFLNNTQLTELIIPETVSEIGGSAFAGCINLTSITSKAFVPPLLYDGTLPAMRRAATVFYGINKDLCVLYVPVGSVSLYAAQAGWNEFKNILEIGSSAIDVLSIDNKSSEIYDMTGRRVREHATTMEGLSKGVYILNGRKVVKK